MHKLEARKWITFERKRYLCLDRFFFYGSQKIKLADEKRERMEKRWKKNEEAKRGRCSLSMKYMKRGKWWWQMMAVNETTRKIFNRFSMFQPWLFLTRKVRGLNCSTVTHIHTWEKLELNLTFNWTKWWKISYLT